MNPTIYYVMLVDEGMRPRLKKAYTLHGVRLMVDTIRKQHPVTRIFILWQDTLGLCAESANIFLDQRKRKLLK